VSATKDQEREVTQEPGSGAVTVKGDQTDVRWSFQEDTDRLTIDKHVSFML
jgi:hypothetical protein